MGMDVRIMESILDVYPYPNHRKQEMQTTAIELKNVPVVEVDLARDSRLGDFGGGKSTLVVRLLLKLGMPETQL